MGSHYGLLADAADCKMLHEPFKKKSFYFLTIEIRRFHSYSQEITKTRLLKVTQRLPTEEIIHLRIKICSVKTELVNKQFLDKQYVYQNIFVLVGTKLILQK